MTRITTLIENSPGEHLALRSEHGLSFCIETGRHMVLFDTGQSGAFMANAAQLRIDLGRLDYVILSHGHYDHSGGLRSLIELTRNFELVTGPGFFAEKYAERNGSYEFLGNNFDQSFIDAVSIRYRPLTEPMREVVPGVFVLGGFPRLHADEVINPRFKLAAGAGFVPDRFDDEVMVVVDTPRGLVAVLGCSHPGMRNMLDAVRDRFGRPIRAVLGGTHLVEASSTGLDASMRYLLDSDIGAIGVSHCTGASAMKILGDSERRYFHNRTGTSLVLD